MIYTPAMGYSLPAVNIPARTLDRIQSKAVENFTPALGYNPGFPRAVLLGPKEYGGEGIPHLYTEAQLQKIEIILSNIRSQTDLGRLLSININYIQLIIGRGESFLSSQYDIPYINNWFMGVRRFLISINAKIVLNNMYLPKLQRQGDAYIMESMAMELPKLSANQSRYINNWRLYYQVQTVSDLCNAKGDQILDIYLRHPDKSDVNLLREDRRTTLLWPIQPPPISKQSFQLWTRYIRKCFLDRSGLKLRSSLGNWIVNPKDSDSIWKYYYSISNKSLIVRTATGLQCFNHPTRTTPGTTSFSKSSFDIVQDIPFDFIPTDITQTHDSYTASHSSRNRGITIATRVVQHTAHTHIEHDIEQSIQQLPEWQLQVLQHFRIRDLDVLLQSLSDQYLKIYIVTDGGMKDLRGSFGVACGTATQELFSIEGPVFGYDEHSNSFRSEAFGMMAGFSFLSMILQIYNITFNSPRKLLAYCDNLSLVRRVQKIILHKTYPRMYIRSESDIILQIERDMNELQTVGINIVLDHVKGHQDDYTPYDQLPREAQLNIAAHAYATNFLCEGTIPQYTEISANPVSFYINDNVITRNIKQEVRNASRSQELRIYMLKKFSSGDDTPDKIWRAVHGSTIKTYNSYDQRRIRKFIFGWLPTSAKLQKYQKVISDKCPSCKTCIETHDHLLSCQSAPRIDLKSKWFESLDRFLQKDQYTPTIVRTIFKDHIDLLFTPETSLSYHTTDVQILAAIDDQSSIGWNQLLRGRLALRWGNIIADHLSANRVDEKEMSVIVWGRTVNRHIYDLMLLLWKKRNEDGHHQPGRKESALTRERLLLRIAAFKQSNPTVSHRHRDFIYRANDILNLYTTSNLRSWLRMAENLVKTFKKQRRQAPTDISNFWIPDADDPNLA